MIDARISCGLPSHPKTKKLIRKSGAESAWRLVCLFLWVAQNKPNGDLQDMRAEDIEIAVDWSGDDGAFVAALLDVGFLDGNEESGYSIHDWEEHNPWVFHSDERAERARFAGLCSKRGRAFAESSMPEYAEKLRQLEANKQSSNTERLVQLDSTTGSTTGSTNSQQPVQLDSTNSQLTVGFSSTPSPSPSPSPSPKVKTIPPDGGGDIRKELFDFAAAIGVKPSMVGKAIKEVGEIEAMAALEQSRGMESPCNAFAASIRNRKAKIEAAAEVAESLKPKRFDPSVLSI